MLHVDGGQAFGISALGSSCVRSPSTLMMLYNRGDPPSRRPLAHRALGPDPRRRTTNDKWRLVTRAFGGPLTLDDGRGSDAPSPARPWKCNAARRAINICCVVLATLTAGSLVARMIDDDSRLEGIRSRRVGPTSGGARATAHRPLADALRRPLPAGKMWTISDMNAASLNGGDPQLPLSRNEHCVFVCLSESGAKCCAALECSGQNM